MKPFKTDYSYYHYDFIGRRLLSAANGYRKIQRLQVFLLFITLQTQVQCEVYHAYTS